MRAAVLAIALALTASPAISASPTGSVSPVTARRMVDVALGSPECTGSAPPRRMIREFDRAVRLVAQAETSAPSKTRRLLGRANVALRQARANAIRAAKGKRPKISSECAMVLVDAADSVAVTANACSVTPINVGDTTSGALAVTDCTSPSAGGGR